MTATSLIPMATTALSSSCGAVSVSTLSMPLTLIIQGRKRHAIACHESSLLLLEELEQVQESGSSTPLEKASSTHRARNTLGSRLGRNGESLAGG